MVKRLFVVNTSFTAVRVETGSKRTLKVGESLFAEFPVLATGLVTFEQDNQEFQVAAQIFLASAAMAKDVSVRK